MDAAAPACSRFGNTLTALAGRQTTEFVEFVTRTTTIGGESCARQAHRSGVIALRTVNVTGQTERFLHIR
jgi:hypothetical protein